MIEQLIIVTNNPMVTNIFLDKHTLELVDGTAMDVFKRVRDYIHLNHKLLTHPLASSIKPNEMPYRTVGVSKNKGSIIDMESLSIIENSMASTIKFLEDFGMPDWSESILEDLRLIDFDIIYNAIEV